jgi:hypothetical protein
MGLPSIVFLSGVKNIALSGEFIKFDGKGTSFCS